MKKNSIYWVRKSNFRIHKDELLEMIESKLDKRYLKISITKNSEEEYDITLYYLNNGDLDPAHPYYEQRPDWQSFYDKAPSEAVSWN